MTEKGYACPEVLRKVSKDTRYDSVNICCAFKFTEMMQYLVFQNEIMYISWV